MAVTISRLNVILSGNMTGLTSVLNGAAAKVKGFEDAITSTGAKITGALGAIGLGVSVAGLGAFVHHSMEAIDTNAKLADRLAFTTEALGGLQHAANLAGVNSEQLTGALEKMLNNLSDAATKGGPAADTIRRMGLDAKELATAGGDKAFKLIADGLAKVENPAQRASMAMDIFGKSGQSLLPLLMSGSEGIAQAQKEAELLGLTFNRVDAAKVEAANDSFTRLQGVITGVGNRIAIGLAPYIDAAEQKLVKMATAGGGIGPKVSGAIEWVARSVAYLSDYLNVLDAGWQAMRGVASYALGSVLDVLGLVVGGVEWLYAKVSGGAETHFGEGMQAVAKGLLEVGDEAFAKAGEDWDAFMARTNSRAVTKAFAEIRDASQSAAEKIAADAAKMGGAVDTRVTSGAEAAQKKIDELSEQLNQFGMTKGEKAARDVALAGGSQEQQAAAAAAANALDKLEQQKKAHEELEQSAKRAWEGAMTPAEKYAKQLDDIQKMKDANLLTDEQAARLQEKADEDLAKATQGKEDKKAEGPKLLVAGTNDVSKFVAEVQARQRSEEHQKEQLAESRRHTGYLKTLADHVSQRQDAPGVESVFDA